MFLKCLMGDLILKIIPVGFTSLMHQSNVNDLKIKEYIRGNPFEVFEAFGKEIIKSDLDCTKELFQILSFKLEKYGDDQLKRQWVEFTKKLIKENKLDLSDELHELITFHYSNLDWRGQGEMILRYLGKDTIFAFRKSELEK